jgi:hypothetical protein
LSDTSNIYILFRKEDHTKSSDCSRGSILDFVSLENEVDVVTKVDTLTIGQRKQMVVIQYGVKGLYPLGINVTIIDDPAGGVIRFFDYLSSRCGQNTILEL